MKSPQPDRFETARQGTRILSRVSIEGETKDPEIWWVFRTRKKGQIVVFGPRTSFLSPSSKKVKILENDHQHSGVENRSILSKWSNLGF